MKHYLKHDAWCIVEEGFIPAYNEISESIFSLGNGRIGQRANFEEKYSGKTLQGNYVAGVYYPDKTRVGWWKNGYPEYFAKVLNAANWIGIDVQIDGDTLDLNTCQVDSFERVLNMHEGTLSRSFVATLPSGKQISVNALRFCSIADDESGAIRYAITPLNFEGTITLTSFIDGDIKNKDANYDEKFWEEVAKQTSNTDAYIVLSTRKTNFEVCSGSRTELWVAGQKTEYVSEQITNTKFVANRLSIVAQKGQEVALVKLAVNLSSLNYAKDQLMASAEAYIAKIAAKGFEQMLAEQKAAWAKKWEMNDIQIEGDVSAQQAIRFNIFQLNQTYTGEDERLNIGPKGFTGEKYGGSTYWDTEAYCIPFYLSTAEQKVARNLLVYRHKQLGRAIENAQKLGFKAGAALYPMVTMNGEECHNEWEITFEEIHRNGAIAYAIYDYVRYTGDAQYLADYGLEVLVGIARFWAQRVNWSGEKKQYVMLGVTGPNEYENNVNNNWYTNYMARWCMQYATEAAEWVKNHDAGRYAEIISTTELREAKELGNWKEIADNMFFPENEELGVFLQQDGYMDKEQILAKDLPASERPLNQKWSWDRILRSCFIKQADVLQGLYFFEENFDESTHRRNFEFYEPRTVHESSLSPCVHSILAAKLGMQEKAYEMYLRTARLDLDDYNNDTEDGLHITSMAGTWMSVVKGFGGMRVNAGRLSLRPFLPTQWESFSFKIRFRNNILNINTSKENVSIENISGGDISVTVFDDIVKIPSGSTTTVETGSLVMG
jgi:maltose phosphorylase